MVKKCPQNILKMFGQGRGGGKEIGRTEDKAHICGKPAFTGLYMVVAQGYSGGNPEGITDLRFLGMEEVVGSSPTSSTIFCFRRIWAIRPPLYWKQFHKPVSVVFAENNGMAL